MFIRLIMNSKKMMNRPFKDEIAVKTNAKKESAWLGPLLEMPIPLVLIENRR